MIRVLIVDDEDLVRSGLRMILDTADDIEVVGEATDGAAAVEAVRCHDPDVVLMDVRMPGMEGLSALTEINQAAAPPKVIMLTTYDLDDYVHTALRRAAAGFLLKDTSPQDLVTAIRTVAAGTAILSPAVTQRLITAFAEQQPPATAVAARAQLELLTEREAQVAHGVARGLSNAEIAREIAVGEPTVKSHVSRALTKLCLANRVQLALLVRDAKGIMGG
ncbi:response regulator [Kribbella albertanoniae]|uniref:Response regulator transcription factor n=1 Tax=Kribbella albertanoniae TaxID=1266829 RepID=A0A4R4QF49_9ACTN|nr:response regulator transcription factor [Kribbella albertanoniae]TDC34134.1 response regulator transcription factor [Kribbella albertanoniae]